VTITVSRALGHSSVAVTSIDLHSSDAAVSELIDLCTSMDGYIIDKSITYVKTESSKKILTNLKRRLDNLSKVTVNQ
jgi:hypothetical protein